MLIPAKSFGDTGIAPAMHDKHGPGYRKSDVEKVIVKMINSDQYFKEQARRYPSRSETLSLSRLIAYCINLSYCTCMVQCTY